MIQSAQRCKYSTVLVLILELIGIYTCRALVHRCNIEPKYLSPARWRTSLLGICSMSRCSPADDMWNLLYFSTYLSPLLVFITDISDNKTLATPLWNIDLPVPEVMKMNTPSEDPSRPLNSPHCTSNQTKTNSTSTNSIYQWLTNNSIC